jgi:DNA-binding transcriptional regulator of glucitol operon
LLPSLFDVRTRWLSPRSLSLHLLLIVWVLGCALAAWWQVDRALAGNQYSYLYAVEWPVFAIAGIFGWWALLHTEPATVEAREERRAHEQRLRAQAQEQRRDRASEDPELAAYNDHLAELAASDRRKGWRH